MNVLIACEESQEVCKAFRAKGHNAYSCDILPCSGGHPEWHIQGDVLKIINGYTPFKTCDNNYHTVSEWDLMIAHPPCTWLCQAMRTNAARKDRPKISSIFVEERQKAFEFVLKLYNAPIIKIAVENPIGYMNQKDIFMKPNQIIRPWMFGHEYNKDVCLWLRNLPVLKPTNIVPGPYKKLDFWSNKRNPNGVSLKSKTFPGIAKAMAEQWG